MKKLTIFFTICQLYLECINEGHFENTDAQLHYQNKKISVILLQKALSFISTAFVLS